MPDPQNDSKQSANNSIASQASNHSNATTLNFFSNYICNTSKDIDEKWANELFLDMPVADLPQHGDLPAGSVMPWRPNRLFTGRKTELLELARQIKNGGNAAVGQSSVVSGLGGQGKTQLSVEFAYRYGRWFAGGVFYIDCIDDAAIPLAIANCAASIFANLGSLSLSESEKIAAVTSAWAEPIPRLLIFDNCECEEIIDRWYLYPAAVDCLSLHVDQYGPPSWGCRFFISEN